MTVMTAMTAMTSFAALPALSALAVVVAVGSALVHVGHATTLTARDVEGQKVAKLCGHLTW